ncbi:MAG: hypothetical protein LQ350_002072 [Teloschistes chrysophthalmus]|nr:MAG: hypothetical protein LQ350_002072 [Niorma chrysophthalma]
MSATTTNNETPKNPNRQPSTAKDSPSPPPKNDNPPYIVTKYLIHFNTELARCPNARKFDWDTINRSADSRLPGQIGYREAIQASAETSSETESTALAQRWIAEYMAERDGGCEYAVDRSGALEMGFFVAVRQDGGECCEVVFEKMVM